MASAILTTRNGPRSSDFNSNYTNNGSFNYTRLQNFSNPNPSPNSTRFFAGNTSRDVIWRNHQQHPHSAPPQAAFTGSPINSVPANTYGYRYVTFRLASYTRRELRELKKMLILDLQRVRILRQCLCKTSCQTSCQKSAVGQKRTNPVPPVRDTKKQCGRTTKAQKTKTMMRECGQILGKLMRHKHGWVFNTPVDAAAMKLYDYHHVITNPMDLGTIKSKLTKHEYDSPIAFASDVRLTFQNAMVYNGKGSDVFIMAERLLLLFEDMFGSMHQKFVVNEMKKQNRAVKVPNATIVEEMKTGSQVVQVNPNPANLGKTMVRVSKISKKPEMTDEEKSELADSIWDMQLGPEGVDQIMAILQKRVSGLEHQGSEIELDLAVLDNDTLWELHGFVSRTRKALVSNLIPSAAQTDYSAGNVHLVEQEEEIDIGEEMHSTVYPSIEIEKDTVNVSSSESSSESDSSSSDSKSETCAGDSCNEQEVNSTPKLVVP